jgi:IclR family pca regulon transcriptional regulator
MAERSSTPGVGKGNESPEPRDSYFVQSLDRGLAVIRAFAPDHPKMTLAEVARRTGMPRAAARRFLLTLRDIGYVRTDGRQFMLSPRVLDLGYSFLSAAGLPAVAHPHLEDLVAEVRHTSSVAVLDEDDVVYVARVAVRRIVTVAIAVGSRFPAYATSLGRVLLAAKPDEWLDAYFRRVSLQPLGPRMLSDEAALRRALEDVRAAGYCVTDQELEMGLRSIAVPVRGAAGDVIAAMNLSLHAGADTVSAMKRTLLPKLRAAAAAVEADVRALGEG